MTLKEDIEGQYERLLVLAKDYDSCLELEPGKGFAPSHSVKKDASEKYMGLRDELESKLSEWMHVLRKSLDMIPLTEKKYRLEDRIDQFEQITQKEKVYESEGFSSLTGFFVNIKYEIEGPQGIFSRTRNGKPIYTQMRNIRGYVLSFSNSLAVFVPDKIIPIKHQVEIIFRLRELGMEKAASELETLDEEEDPTLKCLKARTSLEQIVSEYCKRNGIEPRPRFHHNLYHAIDAGMVTKAQGKSIAAHYSFVSKIVHKEFDPTLRNVQYALQGILNIIDSLALAKSE